jgi:hypothetical protein
MSYTAHVAITIPAGNVTGTVTDYTFLFEGTYAFLQGTGFGGVVTSAVGDDIVLASDSLGATLLDFERISYDPSNGKVQYRARIQVVSGTAYTLYCCYGDATVTSYLGNNHGTWPSIYHAVYHLDGSPLSAVDSTANVNNGTITGAVSAAGQVGLGGSFTASGDTIFLSNTASYRINTPFTIRCWIKLNAYRVGVDGVIMYFQDGLGNFPWYFVMAGNVLVFSWLNGGSNPRLFDTTVIPLNTWTHVAVEVTGATTVKFYVNDVLSSTQSSGTAIPTGFGTGGGLHIGGDSGTNQLNGVIDEFQFLSSTPSTALRSMLYANEFDPSTFYTVLSNVSWSASCTMGLSCDMHSGTTMGFNPSCKMDLVLEMGSAASFGYGAVKCSMDLALDMTAKSTMSYNSPKCTIDLVLDMTAETSTGTVPITCISGTGTPGVTPPTHDPGYTY